ncbi:MAG: hypothetical protein IK019_09835 [Clostridia bacterium]|nr:hypothetical protein [Clostridia bacterium]
MLVRIEPFDSERYRFTCKCGWFVGKLADNVDISRDWHAEINFPGVRGYAEFQPADAGQSSISYEGGYTEVRALLESYETNGNEPVACACFRLDKTLILMDVERDDRFGGHVGKYLSFRSQSIEVYPYGI